jgi:hypothetical protein
MFVNGDTDGGFLKRIQLLRNSTTLERYVVALRGDDLKVFPRLP